MCQELSKIQLITELKTLASVLPTLLPEETLVLYMAGGGACILGDYISRATRDFDFIDLGYRAKVGKALRLLGSYDLLDLSCATIPINYKQRVSKLLEQNGLTVYLLSPQDIIAMKIGRYNNKDKNDIKQLLHHCTHVEIVNSIKEVTDYIPDNEKRKGIYQMHLKLFEKDFDIHV